MELKEKLENISGELSKFMSKSNEELKNIGDAHRETKQALEKLEAEYKKTGELSAKQQEQLDAIETKMKNFTGNVEKKQLGYFDAWKEAIRENEARFKELNRGDRRSFSMNLKVAGDMTSANTYTNDVVAPDHIPGINSDPVQNTLRIRSLFPSAVTNSSSVEVIRQTAFTDGTAVQTEGSALGQSDFDAQAYSYPIYTVGGFMRITEQALEDPDSISSYIATKLADYYTVKEDSQLLYGTGSSQLTGVNQNAAAYSAVDNLADANVNKYDVLVDAIRGLVVNYKYSASSVLINPGDFYDLVLTKDGNNQYLYPEVVL